MFALARTTVPVPKRGARRELRVTFLDAMKEEEAQRRRTENGSSSDALVSCTVVAAHIPALGSCEFPVPELSHLLQSQCRV
jgi:hypothetical protein